MQKSNLLYLRVQQVLPLVKTLFNLVISDFGGGKLQPQQVCRWHRTGRSGCHPAGLGMLEEPSGTLQSPSKVQCEKVKETWERLQQRAMRMAQGWDQEAEWAGVVQRFFSRVRRTLVLLAQWWPKAPMHKVKYEAVLQPKRRASRPGSACPEKWWSFHPWRFSKPSPCSSRDWMISRGSSDLSPSGTLMHQRKWTLRVT